MNKLDWNFARFHFKKEILAGQKVSQWEVTKPPSGIRRHFLLVSMLRASRLLVFRSGGFSSPRRVGELVSSAGWTPCQSPRSWPCRWSWCWPARSSVFSSLPGCGSRIWCNETIAESAGGPRPVDTIQISCWLCDTSDQISTSYLQLSYRLSLGWKRSICDNTKSSEWIK